MAISRMQQPRQLQAGGGIMTLQDPRQGYFLGKLVKKAVRGVKKIVKSPLGKAAIMGGLTFGIPGTGFKGLMGSNFMKSALAKGNVHNDPGFLRGLYNKFDGLSTGQKIFTGLGATAVATPFLQKAMGAGPYEEVEEEVDEFIDPYTAMMMARNRDPYMSFLPNEQFAQEGFYLPQNAANGGRIGYADGMMVEEEDEMLGLPTLRRRGFANGEMVEAEQMVETEGPQLPPEAEKFLRQEYQKYVAQGGDLSYPEFKQLVLQQASGEQGPEQEEIMASESETVQTEPQMPMMMAGGGAVPGSNVPGYTTPAGYNRFDYRSGGVPTRVGAEEGGLMNLGGMEKDYRAEGGFVPIGKREKADDVPARLSVNEFVFTADAVRNAGGGDIDKGAEVMENLMNNLESGGKVSEDSQGLEGAQAMYDQQQMLQSRME